MTPTKLAEELHAIECNIHPTVMGALRPRWQCEVRAAALLALPPDRRAALAAELLDVEGPEPPGGPEWRAFHLLLAALDAARAENARLRTALETCIAALDSLAEHSERGELGVPLRVRQGVAFLRTALERSP